MPGFLGASSGGAGGTGGEISFPKEFVDPVTKLRVSNPENLIDTDFEYGLQPTKWETVELINNTPSFFSKSGDTTIDGIVSMTTNAGTREITVETALDHNLAVGIPINVTGSKSLTADGSFIIASIPNSTTFTYLCKSNQAETVSINDLYTSIITGEFFQGSQIGIDDSEGIITDGGSTSILTVKTKSTHGFGEKTPLYLLNINSTISQDFQSANTASLSFDASNSATAQTFDGSNTLTTTNIDWSNSGVEASQTSTISSVSTTNNTITVTHGAENFSELTLGTPLYYDVQSGTGFFNQNPRGVVFLKSTDGLGPSTSEFTVSELPDGNVIPIEAGVSGTFQVSDLSRTFAGNNINPATQTQINIVRDSAIVFDGGNQGYDGAVQGSPPNNTATIVGFTSDVITVAGAAALDYYEGAMIFYNTSGSAASGLTNNTTYFVKTFSSTGTSGIFSLTIAALPGSEEETLSGLSGGTGTQTFEKIGVSLDKDIVHVKNSFFAAKDMLEYEFPANGNFGADSEKVFYFVFDAYDQHNYTLRDEPESFIRATGGSVTQTIQDSNNRDYTVHRFTNQGTFTFTVTSPGNFEQDIKYVVTDGSYDGTTTNGAVAAAIGSYTVVVNAGGRVDIAYPQDGGTNDIEFSTIFAQPIRATGGSVSSVNYAGDEYKIHRFSSSGTFEITQSGLAQDLKFITSGNSTFDGVSNTRGTDTSSVKQYTVVVGSGGFVDVAYPDGSQANSLPYTEIRAGSGQQDDPATSPDQLDAFVLSEGSYYFQPTGIANPIQMTYRPNMQDGRGWVRVFQSSYRSTATTNLLGQSIPWKGILFQRSNNTLRGYTYFSTAQLYNGRSSGATSTGGNRSGYRVFLGGGGGHGIYNTSQNPCSWGNSSGAVGAGYDGNTCGSFPNDLIWGTGNSGATYSNRSGNWDNWIWWD